MLRCNLDHHVEPSFTLAGLAERTGSVTVTTADKEIQKQTNKKKSVQEIV